MDRCGSELGLCHRATHDSPRKQIGFRRFRRIRDYPPIQRPQQIQDARLPSSGLEHNFRPQQRRKKTLQPQLEHFGLQRLLPPQCMDDTVRNRPRIGRPSRKHDLPILDSAVRNV